ncbi:MAG: sirohydrochlorin cobaltochelatase, partial [Oscillospiraceae bacterium]|nr:sirohydrochlorin cobaltochelatase [Oscillospiraceae bacterium]
MSEKKAIAAVSFGTTHADARRAIENVERALAAAFPERDFYRAFTSGMVARKILREEGIAIPNAAELAEQLLARGCRDAVFQSLHVIAGSEYDKLLSQLAPYRAQFDSLTVGKPLLWSAEDYAETADILLAHMAPPRDGEAYVFMGHGSEHPMNAAYSQLENTLRARGRERVYIGTVEGFPELSYVEGRLRRAGVKKARLAPLMLTAGEHAKNDLAGERDSWASQLRREGYEVEVNLTGLGEYDEIA